MVIDRRLSDSSWRYLDVGFGGLFLKPKSSKALGTLRASVHDCLDSVTEISEVTDLFDSGGTYDQYTHGNRVVSLSFPPLIATVSLPYALQPISKEYGYGQQAAKFVIIVDGTFLIIAAVCAAHDYIVSFPDVRDKIVEILTRTCKAEIIPPNVIFDHLRVENKGKDLSRGSFASKEPVLHLKNSSSIKHALRAVYSNLARELLAFYYLAGILDEDLILADVISKKESKLLDEVRKFLGTRLLQIFRRRSIAKGVRLQINELLLLLSAHSYNLGAYAYQQARIESFLQEQELAWKLLDSGSARWKTLLGPAGTVDTAYTLAMIEHAQSEVQTSAIMSITIWAAVVGAIVGSIIAALGYATAVLSKLLAG